MTLRTHERQRIYEADWGFASIASALQSKGVAPERAARALRLLRRKGVPDGRLGSALVLVFHLAETGFGEAHPPSAEEGTAAPQHAKPDEGGFDGSFPTTCH